jgi:SIR2-like domain
MTAAKRYMPDQLIRDAAKHGELVVFVGAGASRLCGSPDWPGFASGVVDVLEKVGVVNFLEAEQLRGLGDSRRTISIALALAKESNTAIDFDHILHPRKPAQSGSELFELLSSLRPVFVTTNYDKWLDEAGPGEISTEVKTGGEAEPASGPGRRPKYHLREQLSPALLAQRGAVIHLHGSFSEPNKMVVSLKDYIEHYADSRVQEFLSAMFKNHTVLFVGYGLAELEILEHIIRSNESLKTGATTPRHFLLYPHRSTESVQKKFVERYLLEQCGVCVIPYLIDTNGYEEVVEVFKVWNSELDVRDPSTLDLQAHLDRCIASPTDVNRDAALRFIEKRPDLTAYLLNALNDPVWFSQLDAAGYFKVQHSPGVEAVEGEGGITSKANGWPALRYLERIARSVQQEQASRIAAIVRAISADAQRRGLDNWRTWWSLATVLTQLPLSVLTEDDIRMIPEWLGSRFDSTMVGHELGTKLLPRLLESAEPADWRKALSLVDALSMLRPKGESS